MQSLLITYHNPLRICDAADFDGTNDNIFLDPTGNPSDSKSGILSCWVRVDGGDGTARHILSSAPLSSNFLFIMNNTNTFAIGGDNAAGTEILLLRTAGTFFAGATWRHILASWDLAAGAGHLYINDVPDLGTSTLTNDTIDYTQGSWALGSDLSSTNKMNGALAELYFAPGQYLDFSKVYYRRKFISASGKPVHLGTTGALPTGTAPWRYHHLDDGEAVANFVTNRGSGVDDPTLFGTLDTASTSPSD